MEKVIIIRGPAGVGKTTIGKLLAETLNNTCIHVDKILKQKGLDFVKGEKWVPPENFMQVNKMIKPIISENLQKGKNVIIEGNFYHKSVLKDLSNRIKGIPIVFDLKADVKECMKRDTTRKGIGPEAINAVHKLVSAFDYGIIINTTNKTPNDIVEEVINHLRGQKP